MRKNNHTQLLIHVHQARNENCQRRRHTEINLPHENWIPSVVRAGFKADEKHTSTITLYDLLRAAVRQRPDYIIVGEVRGDEAYTLFQAMATHLGMCTIHADL